MSVGLIGLGALFGLAGLSLALHFCRDRIEAWLKRQDAYMLARADANRRGRLQGDAAQAERDLIREEAARVLASQPSGRQD